MLILLRSIFVWVFGVLLTLFLGIIALIFSLFKAQKTVHKIAILWGKTLAYISGIEIEVNNPENLVKDETIVIVSNHQSMFDILVFYSFLDIQFRWLAKASLFKIPIFGQGMRGAGYIPVEREDRKKSKESLFEAAEHVKKGTSLILFPEGTRGHPDGTLLPFKKGAFVLAKMAEVTIQPITIWGANRAVPKQEGKW
ncbi:MAG: 1-acyl-sn-glycerol-3-phosphate acyltransferase, partial [Leptospiraceae bacterium]|nr:1-acyl-sn-glycerol-3-phosphate acyltransferase [Leptospiraceae bacterium]